MAIKQISIFLEDRPGAAVEVTNILADNNVDMRAINIAETENYGVLRLIVDDSERAVDILNSQGFVVKEIPVVAMEVPDRTGGLNEALAVLSEENINIRYMYSVLDLRKDMVYIILRVDDTGLLEQALVKAGFRVAESKDLKIK